MACIGGGGGNAKYGVFICRGKGYGLQAVYSGMRYINQNVWV